MKIAPSLAIIASAAGGRTGQIAMGAGEGNKKAPDLHPGLRLWC